MERHPSEYREATAEYDLELRLDERFATERLPKEDIGEVANDYLAQSAYDSQGNKLYKQHAHMRHGDSLGNVSFDKKRILFGDMSKKADGAIYQEQTSDLHSGVVTHMVISYFNREDTRVQIFRGGPLHLDVIARDTYLLMPMDP